MYAIIGKYKVRMEETGLVLKHATGISFDLTPDEALALLDFINAYRQTLIQIQGDTEVTTQPVIHLVTDEDEKNNEQA